VDELIDFCPSSRREKKKRKENENMLDYS